MLELGSNESSRKAMKEIKKGMMMIRKYASILTAVSLTLALSGCLKTRAQLREDSEEGGGAPTKASPVQDVQPQGQYALDEIKGELTRLNGRIEDLERAQQQNGASGAKSEDLKKHEARIIELETAQTQMLEAIKKIQSEPAVSANPEEAYDHAHASFDAGDFEAAVSGLDNYLKNPKAKRAQDATFLRAEAYFNLKQYKKAIVDYSKFPEKYTASKHMPTALLKIGQSFDALGMHDDAKGFYQELNEKFPKSPEAKRIGKAKLK